jgi:phage tail-like protein
MTVDAYPTCRFYVEVDGVSEAVFTEVSGLQVEIETMDYQEGGTNDHVYRLPGRAKLNNLTLKRGIGASPEFLSWCMDVAQGKIKRRSITVVMYDVAGHKVARWSFDKAYPVKWVGPQLKSNEAAMAIETLELAHAGFRMG